MCIISPEILLLSFEGKDSAACNFLGRIPASCNSSCYLSPPWVLPNNNTKPLELLLLQEVDLFPFLNLGPMLLICYCWAGEDQSLRDLAGHSGSGGIAYCSNHVVFLLKLAVLIEDLGICKGSEYRCKYHILLLHIHVPALYMCLHCTYTMLNTIASMDLAKLALAYE